MPKKSKAVDDIDVRQSLVFLSASATQEEEELGASELEARELDR